MKSDTAIYTAFDDHKPLDPAGPERHLMLAILRAAMEDMNRRGEPYRDARRYFLSNDEQYLFSFVSVCRHLNICVKTIRLMVGLESESSEDESRLAA